MHLTNEAALDLVEGHLSREQETIWARHLETCNNCANQLLAWRQLSVDLKRSHLMSAPDQDLRKVISIFQPQPAGSESTIRTILASIVFDSFLQPALGGARGGTTSTARQLVLRAEEFDIHIKIWGDRDGKQMLGQLLPRHGKGFVGSARFHLVRNGERVESTTTDETGEFRFTDVPEGDLSLQIDLPNLTVVGALNVQQIE
jgi:hypothetical protein